MKQFCGVVFSLVFAGCASIEQPAGFLENYGRLVPGRYFKQEYAEKDAQFSRYRKVWFEPVDMGHFREEHKFSREERDKLASEFEKAFQARLASYYSWVDRKEKVDGETLRIETALVSVGTPRRALNVVTTALVFVPVSGGSAAFEARIRDGLSGRVLAEIAEKRTAGTDAKSLTAGPFMKFAHAEAAFKKWAEGLAVFLKEGENGN